MFVLLLIWKINCFLCSKLCISEFMLSIFFFSFVMFPAPEKSSVRENCGGEEGEEDMKVNC